MTLTQQEPTSIKIGTTSVSKVFVGTRQVRPDSPAQTFDFQNDGSLNWTAVTGSYGTPDFVTGKGWRIYRSNTNSQGNILPPSSAFTGTLKGIRMRIYKGFVTHGTSAVAYGVGAGVACGNNRFIWSFMGANINYDRINYKANASTDSFITTIDYSGEAKLELNLEGTTPILYINDENAYTLTGSVSSGYKDYWTNGTLAIVIGSWRGGSDDIYIRKIQFITE